MVVLVVHTYSQQTRFVVVLFFIVRGDVMNHDLQLVNIVFVCTDVELL